jgi:hypothetical protein
MNKIKLPFRHKELLGLGTSQANGILKKSSCGLHKTIIYVSSCKCEHNKKCETLQH